MNQVGIEAMNVYAGTTYLNVNQLAEHRNLELARFNNLLMNEKTVALPYEDPITFGVNAAKPLIDALSPEEKDRVEMVISCTESGFDFGKSMSTYYHQLLGLNRNCRLFEIKNACYSGAVGLQMAVNFIIAQTSPGAKVLVIATDIARFILENGKEAQGHDWSFAEPSGGAGAVAMLVSDIPKVFQVDIGANGYYGYEVMDTCRPSPEGETGDADLSLLSYLDCCENSFLEYRKRVPEASYTSSFQYLAFHTPFAGMVKGAHRKMMRKLAKAKPGDIEADFQERLAPGLNYCQRVGNTMGATTMFALFSTIEHGEFESPKRIGCFSYGSGCCSEFFSGVTTKEGQDKMRALGVGQQLDNRYELSMGEYDELLRSNNQVKFGTRNVVLDMDFIPKARQVHEREILFLREIKDYHREYEWIS